MRNYMEISEKLKKQIHETKYLSVENTERYRPIIRYFFKQYEKLEYWLYKEDVFNALRENDDFIDYTLDLCEQDLLRLVEWGNLTHIQDTSNVQTVEEFKNRKYRYQLTQYTIEIERMVIRLENLHIENASLEPKLFEKLKNLLLDFPNYTDLADINFHFEELNETFQKLNDNYRDFLNVFHESKSEELMKSEQFLLYKDKVIEYLKNFISGFQISEIKIKQILKEYPENFEDTLIEKVLEYKKSQPILESDFDFEHLEEVLRGKWNSITKWFLDNKYEESEIERLKKAINNIIRKITKYAVSIIENNSSVNRMEEYRHILSLFLKSKSLEEMEKLSTVVFGIEKVKHFSNIEKTTDSINLYANEVEPSFIALKSHSRLMKEKSEKRQVEDNFFEKENQLKQILQEKKRKQDLLQKYIKQGTVCLKDLENIESFERRFLLSLITKGYNKEKVKASEFDIYYKVEEIDGEEIILKSMDGNLTMKNLKITFLEDKNGV